MQGTRLGPYEILEQLGAGGMGEVWLAQDTRLGRKVAVKVLPSEFASDPERLARFEQEARAAAALNHPHIAAVYDVGHENGTHFIVQEHLQGRTLRAAIAEGRLPLAHALKLAIEVAEALRAAHGAGIIHRDLKPENVFVSEDRHAKVLDFGLAKLTEIAIGSGDQSASMSPTVLGTVAGQMMGTAGYMAPEQIEGTQVDARADLFAFGCLLYELATGQQAFRGKNMIDTLHKVSNADADALVTIDGSLPADLQRLLDKALAKDPASRYQTAGDLAVDLRGLLAAVEGGTATPVALEGATAGGRGLAPAAVAGIALASALLGALGLWAFRRPPEPAPVGVTHLEFGLASDDGFSGSGRRPLAISPDGRRVAFTDEGSIWLRELSGPELIQVRGTEDPRGVAFSPDSQWLVFFSSGELRKVPITGGAAIRLADLDNPVGMHWEADGRILVAQPSGQIVSVPENGGDPEVLVELEDGQEPQGPSLLPGGDWLLFALSQQGSAGSDAQVVAQSLSTGERRVLISGGTEPRTLPGTLTFARDGNLLAVPFDAGRLEVTGGAVVLVEGFPMAGSGGAYYDLSERGDLVYFAGVGTADVRKLAAYDADGNLQVLPFDAAALSDPAVAPDGNRIAALLDAEAGDRELWIYEIDRTTRQRLTPAGVGVDSRAVWSPDGEWIYARLAGDRSLYRIRTDFTGTIEQIGADGLNLSPTSASDDGRRLAGTVNGDIAVVDLESGDMDTVVATPAGELLPSFAPDGRYLAYTSIDSGDLQVFVRDLETGQRDVASTQQGVAWGWSPEGDALYYSTGPTLMAVPVTYQPAFRLGVPETKLEMPARLGFPNNDVVPFPDGDRFLILTGGEGQAGEAPNPGRMHVIVDWAEVLRQRLAVQ